MGGLGLTICYDIRFPQLYKDLALAGADMLSIPAAFTVLTGKAHWHILQRARAIETGSFVIAAAQCGEHPGGPPKLRPLAYRKPMGRGAVRFRRSAWL